MLSKKILSTQSFVLLLILVFVVGVIVPPGIGHAATNERDEKTANNSISDQEQQNVENDLIHEGERKTVSENVYGSFQKDPMVFNGKKVKREVKEKRTANSTHYLLEDGTFAATISSHDVYFEDANGEWQEINTDLIDEADLDQVSIPISKESAVEVTQLAADNLMKKSSHTLDRSLTDFMALQVPYKAKIPKDYSKGYSMGKGRDKLTFIPQNAIPSVGRTDSSRPNEVLYNGAWNDTDVKLEVTDIGIKETIILQNENAPNTFSFEVKGGLSDQFEAGDLSIQSAWLEDVNGETRDVTQTIRKNGSKTYLELHADTQGLVFPINIDPSVSIRSENGGMDAYVRQLYPTENFNNDYLRIGTEAANSSLYYIYSYIKFDLSSIPSYAVTSSASLNLWVQAAGTNRPDTVLMYEVLSSWNENTLTYNKRPTASSTYFTMLVGNSGAWTAANIPNSLLQKWVSNSAQNYGVYFRGNVTNQSNSATYISSNNVNTTLRPYLYVTYTANLAPGEPTVTAPNGGENIDTTYNITWNAATDPDNPQASLKYQIQYSPDNGSSWADIVALTAAGQTSYTYDFSSKPDTTNALIRVRAYDGILYGPWDQSDATFTILHNSPPNAPLNPSPGSASASTPALVTPTPSLNWTFSDPDAWDVQSAYDITIYNGTASVYDSGWVNGSTGSFTVPTSANLARGTVYNWKVKTKDSKGAISPQSAAMYIKTNTLPVATLTSYTDGQTVPDNILTFTWNYSDSDNQTQAAYQIQGSQNNFSTIAYDSGTLNGTATSFTTPPLGSGSWNFRVRVFDGTEWSNWVNRNNLTLPNTFEPNDDMAHAFPILYNTTYSTFIGSSTDIDFFKYTASTNGIDRVTLTPPSGKNYDVYVYDSNSSPLAIGGRGIGLTENIIYEVTAGTTYYIKVVGINGDFSTTSTYSFALSSLAIQYQTNYQYDNNGNITGKTTTKTN